MPNNSTSACDLRELASLLRKERLFVSAEQENVEQLRNQVSSLTDALTEQAWVAAQQRRNLQLLVTARKDCYVALHDQRSYASDGLSFVDAGSILGYSEAAAYGDFFVLLRDSPELIAACLSYGDRSHPDKVPGIVHTVSAGIYGSCLLAIDKRLVLRLLRHLGHLQLAPSDNPRRLLHHGSCAFARLYSAFHENLHTARLFLTAALHGPIMALLAEDEVNLDIDPEKAALRFPNQTPAQQRHHREATVRRLHSLTELFIDGLRGHVFCFPPSVSWLLRQLVCMFTKAGFLREKEVGEICVDLLLTHFICPAIVHPEPHGIIEAPVSETARFNLMQVAQILHKLALSKYEDWDPKDSDLFSRFQADCVWNILSNIVEGGSDSAHVPIGGEGDLEGVSRGSVLLTSSQLNALVSFLQTVASAEEEIVDRRQLESLLSNLPPLCTNGHNKESVKPRQQEGGKRGGLLGKAVRQRSHTNGDTNDDVAEEPVESVLVIRLPGQTDGIELLTESKVLEMEEKQDVAPTLCVGDGQDLPDSADTSQSQEKRTRFSLSHDEGSIGNTSDNLEAISEAASNHSGASSLESENEDQNDNLSDMVSANVSGRGSPNISGRDTPSSQITEGEAQDRPQPVPPPVTKQTRSDIEDKFCKFEIKKPELLADETVSMVSDTWSTDVLASDSETVDQGDRFVRPPDDGPPHPFIQHSLDISETASEAWSTDVMASDSERLTEVDTDDTASVARSDDTAASETGDSRPRDDDPGTPPPSAFRPISRAPRVDDELPRLSLIVPASPTRGESSTNVTGRGGGQADYKRRTQEFVGNLNGPGPLPTLESPRMIHVIDKMDGINRTIGSRVSGRSAPRSPHSVPSVVSDGIEAGMAALTISGPNEEKSPVASQSTDAGLTFEEEATPPASYLNSFKPPTPNFVAIPKAIDGKIKPENEEGERVFLSSTSLASTSSSSSNAAASSAQIPEPKVASTGAIPKSISFDKTADKEFLEDKKQKKGGGFFGNFKMSFRNRNRKKPDCYDGSLDGLPRVRRGQPLEDTRTHNGDVEDILAKYRGKAAEEPEIRCKRPSRDVEEETWGPSDESIFLNAKRKLRIVFSRADLQSWPPAALREQELVSFLQLQLAEARSLQNRGLVSQLHETLRCVKLFDTDGCRRLVAALRSDLAARTVYAAYLTRARQTLLSRAAHLTRLTDRIRVETRLTNSFLLSLCVRLFLERREERCTRFTHEFRAVCMPDEKTDVLDAFLEELEKEMERDSTWHGVSEVQRIEALSAVETSVLSRVYPYAFYPNGDGDISRDQVFHEHVKLLASRITPNHKDLQIPKRFHGECPWPSAQAELASLSAYKTPRDKVACVSRCANTINYLLALASEGSVPAADEFLPVLVFVIISANPPALLSTVQYVDSFYPRICGEDQYWWTQFCSAIELLKTMDV